MRYRGRLEGGGGEGCGGRAAEKKEDKEMRRSVKSDNPIPKGGEQKHMVDCVLHLTGVGLCPGELHRGFESEGS